MAGDDATSFGKCCPSLEEALEGGEFEPLITVGDDGILYMSIGVVAMDESETGMIDHPVYFCPFCGTALQTAAEVDAKTKNGEPN